MNDYNDAYYKANNQDNDRIMLWFYSRIVKKYLRGCDKTILDFGCGVGHLIKRFNKYTCFGVDVSSFAIEKAKNNAQKCTFYRSINEIADNSINFTITLHTLEHLENIDDTIKQFNNKMQKNGYLLVVVPNLSALGKKLKGNDWFAYKDKTHVSLLEESKWFNIIESNGFKIIKKGTDGLWNPPYWGLPLFLEKLICYLQCGIQILLGKLIIPKYYGEDLIILAQKK